MDKKIKETTISFLMVILIFQFSCSPKVTMIQTNVPDAGKKPIQKDSGFVNISSYPPVTDYLVARNNLPSHPRILLLKGQEQIIKNNILSDNSLAKVDNAILTECDKMILLSPLKRVLVGNQILETSREALRRIFYLSYAYRTTRQIKYFNRAEQELISVCAFSDWNPQQSFLDCAEMTTAVAIGYDWLFDNLSDSDKAAIKSAITEKGLKPSLDPKNNFWLKWTNNWNQVCNTGMALGAMAVYEDDPRFARMIINRAIETIRIPMNDEYSPNGCFIEGYSYWNYGTGYNVLFLAALQKLFGTDFDLNSQQGFMQTGTYFENMTSPNGATFNYSDSFEGDYSAFPDVSMFWFASQLKKPSLLWVEHGYLVNSPPSKFTNNRFLPMLPLLDSGINTSQITPPTSDLYVGQGKNPVAMMRTSWTDPNAIYVGVKAGSPAVSHGHMDIGSFVMDANGVRWAADPGGGNYNKILAKGVNLWDESQNSTRWKSIFEYTNMAHNTLTVNNANQKVNGNASFIASSENPAFRNVVADLTSVYSDLLTKAIRGVAIVNSNYVAIRDEITPINSATLVKWSMLTPASVSIISNNKAELTLNGQKLLLQVQEPSNVILKTWTVAFTNTYAAASKGNTYIGFETNLLNSNVTPITVLLIPEGPNLQSSIPKVPAIKDWPKQ